MILDSSAIVAMYLEEPGHEAFYEAAERADVLLVGAPTVFETAMVLSTRTRQDAYPGLSSFLRDIGAQIIPFTQEHASVATAAFLRFGRGHHPARLDLGDCMSYAIAAQAGMPLLFKGDDFSRTDVARV